MKQSAIIRDEKAPDRFLAAPMKTIRGTTITCDGVPDRRERAGLIVCLRQVDPMPDCRGSPPSRP